MLCHLRMGYRLLSDTAGIDLQIYSIEVCFLMEVIRDSNYAAKFHG